MSRTILINLFRFVILVVIQVFLLKNLPLYGLPIPYFYILFILLLPFNIPNLLLFGLSFLTGLCVDAFYDTPGLNAAACVALAFVRIIFISLTVPKEGFDNDPEPGIMGFRWFFTYALILTLAHHFVLFAVEVFNVSGVPYIFVHFLTSSLFTLILMLISGLIFFRRKERK